jgi:glycosyltransferase involved in cell wall biosynthesis
MAEAPSSGGRVGVAMAGDPFDPAAWSGIPMGLSGGIREHGAEPVPLDALPRAQVRYPVMAAGWVLSRDRLSAGNSAALHRLASRKARRAIARAPELEGVVQLGTEFSLPPGVRYVNLLDMTVAQAHLVHPHFASASRRTMRAWVERQRAIFHDAAACCPAARWAADSLHNDYGVPWSSIHVVGFGANHVVTAPERDWSTPHYLFVGQDWERKNGPMLLRAFARVRRRIPEATLDLVGGHPPVSAPAVTGHGLLHLREAAERQRFEQLLRRATCFVLPSSCEPFGIVYVEAGLTGLPSVGTTVGGAVDAIGDDGGIVVDPDDEDALAAALIELADPDRAAETGERARRRASDFTWSKVAERVLGALGNP